MHEETQIWAISVNAKQRPAQMFSLLFIMFNLKADGKFVIRYINRLLGWDFQTFVASVKPCHDNLVNIKKST